jgi:hypothetical protein
MKNVMRIFWKGVGFMVKLVALLILLAILAPIAYLAWRAGQPMAMPEFGGQTYYGLLSDRKQAYEALAEKFQTFHPSTNVKREMCFQSEIAVSLASTLPWAGICAASEFVPALRFYGPKSKHLGCGQMGGSWTNFPATWWRTYEKLLYEDIYVTAPDGPVEYCRISAL